MAGVYIYREREENQFYFTATCSAMAGVYIYIEREREYCTVRLTPPPWLPLWSKSWKWSTALHSMQLYIFCHFMYCVIWSWASGQVSHAFLSIANICQFLYHFMMLLLLLLLCITPQHTYVVVVVVYYTTGTMTTTKFREIDYVVFVK